MRACGIQLGILIKLTHCHIPIVEAMHHLCHLSGLLLIPDNGNNQANISLSFQLGVD